MTATVDEASTAQYDVVPERDPDRGWRPPGLFQLRPEALAARAAVVLGITGLILAYILTSQPFRSDNLSAGVVVALGALSLNVLVGYSGQISLGHQAFIGIGAFISAYVISETHQSFYVGVGAAVAVGAIQAVVLGLIALRVRGLYFGLVTLGWGFVAENSLFRLRSFTGGGEGRPAPRPGGFQSDRMYLLLCCIALAVILLVDWRLVATKAGRAMQALRESPQVAANYGVNVRGYTLLSFAVSGFYAGLAGALSASRALSASPADYTFVLIALPYLIVTVVGGLRRRGGIVVFAVLFAISGGYLKEWALDIFGAGWLAENAAFLVQALSGLLAILTLIFQPDGVGTITAPIGRWLKGERFRLHGDS